MRLLLLFILLLGLYACSEPQRIEDEEVTVNKGIAEHVIVIGIDGMSPNGIMNANTPNIDFLVENGAATMNARAVLPTSSSSNWASMIMGAGPEQHGVTSNNWERDEYTLPPISTGMEDIFPTIFSVLREQKPDAEIAAIYHWDGFGRLFEKSAVDYDRHGETEYLTTEYAVEYIESKKPTFCFVHLDHVDHAGHHYGHGTPEYFASVETADSLIGQIVESVQTAGIAENTVIILSSDHGGIGYGHGGETPEEITIPFVVYGKQVVAGKTISHELITYDNAATVAFILGIEQPYAWIGRPIKSAFEGYPDPKSNMKVMSLAKPNILPLPVMYAKAGGLFIDKSPEVVIEKAEYGTEIRFTLDGSEPTEKSTLYTAPFILEHSTVVMAKVFNKDGEESPASVAYFRTVSSSNGNGISYSYYKGNNWEDLPDMSKLKAAKTGNLYEFEISEMGSPEALPQFAVRMESYIKIDTEGDYTFYTYSDDGSKLYIDGEQVVDNGGQHGTIERGGGVNLKAGYHKITVDYFNHGGGGWLEVFYKGPQIPKQILSADKLYLKQPI